MSRISIGNFKVLALPVEHGDCPNYAYHITMPDGQTLLFATDLERFPYSIKGINHICIESNYSEELMLDTLINGDILRSQSQSHMELEETITTIKRLQHGGLQGVILVHLSNGLSDEQMFKDRIFSETGIRCDIANAGSIYELKNDF